MFVRVFIFIACVALPAAWAYSAGAPSVACGDMVPQHGVAPQQSSAPYKLLLSTKSVRAGNEIQLELKGNGKGDTIKGFMVQARVGDQPVGLFKVEGNNKLVQTLNCGNGNQVRSENFKLVFFRCSCILVYFNFDFDFRIETQQSTRSKWVYITYNTLLSCFFFVRYLFWFEKGLCVFIYVGSVSATYVKNVSVNERDQGLN